MNVFIIHKGNDEDFAQLVKDVIEREKDMNVLVLENGGRLWKNEAAKLIRKSQMLLFLVGPKSYESPNIGWEIKQAINNNKPISCVDLKNYEKLRETIKKYRCRSDEERKKFVEEFLELDSQAQKSENRSDCYRDHEALKVRNSFTKDYQQAGLVKKFKSIHDVLNMLKRHINGEYEIFNQAFENLDKEQLFEQYKTYLETSEQLINRRQNVNNFYITVNAAIITLCSTILALSDDINAKLMIMGGMAIMGIMLDYSWINLLDAYGILNSSKMKIISLIEKRLPVSLYNKEWIVMSDKLNSKKYISFTDSEKRIPKLFCMIYIILIIALLAVKIMDLLNVIQ